MGRPQVGPQQLISVEIPVDLLDQVRQAARAEERSVSGTVRVALREYLERRNGPAAS
jgi:metal-responsive CopG/Arc/MetJ family transcriptional regulator